jgi:hypothetical protein
MRSSFRALDPVAITGVRCGVPVSVDDHHGNHGLCRCHGTFVAFVGYIGIVVSSLIVPLPSCRENITTFQKLRQPVNGDLIGGNSILGSAAMVVQRQSSAKKMTRPAKKNRAFALFSLTRSGIGGVLKQTERQTSGFHRHF